MEHEDLRAVAVLEALAAAPVLELDEGQLGEEIPIAGEPPEQRAHRGEALLVGRVEALLVERLDELAERDRRLILAVDDPGHVRPPFWSGPGAARCGRA